MISKYSVRFNNLILKLDLFMATSTKPIKSMQNPSFPILPIEDTPPINLMEFMITSVINVNRDPLIRRNSNLLII